MNPKTRHIIRNYVTGKFRCSEFALTNACIAKCTFCSIWKQQPKVYVDREKALQAVNRLADFGVSHMCFTGGEALLHPNCAEIVAEASRRKIHSAVLIAAPGLLLRKDMTRRLEDAGCDIVSISFDSGDPAVMAESRQIENIMDEMRLAVEEAHRTRIKSMASVLIWNGNYDKLDEVFESARQMGFDLISLNYPTFSESQVYELGGEGITLSRGQLIQSLESAIALKKEGKYKLINSEPSMRNIISYLKDPNTAKYHCRGGRRVFFVDWFFDLYPCMQLAKPIGNLFEVGESDLRMPACNACNMSWYRDMSMFFNGPRSIPVLFEAMLHSSDAL
ncbi:MAG: radical SAM protein [Oscillospiraceae bacterium]|jgi:MoaA/NifB/PqqE/SkfB family radical SAM enzyme|nr:radical SAM protein [Oscillospiraceae bacterium]